MSYFSLIIQISRIRSINQIQSKVNESLSISKKTKTKQRVDPLALVTIFNETLDYNIFYMNIIKRLCQFKEFARQKYHQDLNFVIAIERQFRL